MILCRKLGPRIVQIIGASLNAAGLLATAFTIESWQGLITNGIIAGNQKQSTFVSEILSLVSI